MRALIAGAFAMTGAFSAMAEDTSRDDWLLTSINQDTIEFVVTSSDHQVRGPIDDSIGVVAVYTDASDGDELVYALQGKACGDGSDCLGLQIFVIFTGDFSQQQANSINERWSAIKATIIEDDLYLTRYLILDKGQTLGNLKVNITTALAIAEQVAAENETFDQAAAPPAPAPQPAQLNYGEDTGLYANDGACDDARFHADGDTYNYQRDHVLADATDCRTLYEAGEITLHLDFGDDSGNYAFDNTCDDNRFSGEGRSILTIDSHVKRDATDCITAYKAARLSRP